MLAKELWRFLSCCRLCTSVKLPQSNYCLTRQKLSELYTMFLLHMFISINTILTNIYSNYYNIIIQKLNNILIENMFI